MNASVTRRGLLRAGSAALGAVLVPIGATVLTAAAPLAFYPAAFIADLKAAGYGVVAYYPVPRGGEPAEPPGYFIRPPKGRGFGVAYTAVMTKWRDAMNACPDHVERVASHVSEHFRSAA